MADQNQPKSYGLMWGGIIALFFIVMIIINQWMSRQANTPDVQKHLTSQSRPVDQVPSHVVQQPVYENVVRKTWFDPNREFYESAFFAGDEEIAHFKSLGEDIYDVTGKIPDGKITFTNITESTYGDEHYRDGKRNGTYREYYKNEQLKREAYYFDGTLVTNKEYFFDGTLRMEQDFSDAMSITENREVGVGKIYYRNGKIMYEYHLTNKSQGGFNRSYDRNGVIVAENSFDQNGDLIRSYKKENNENNL